MTEDFVLSKAHQIQPDKLKKTIQQLKRSDKLKKMNKKKYVK
jgi:hypothetical protein